MCCTLITSTFVVSIHVLRRGRCVIFSTPLHCFFFVFQSTSSEEDVVSAIGIASHRTQLVSIHVLRRGRCVRSARINPVPDLMFQSTSSEEDVVSQESGLQYQGHYLSFNPRPPKRTLCLACRPDAAHTDRVSIHVLRRGRCVTSIFAHPLPVSSFNPRPPKRTLCPVTNFVLPATSMFQSTSSEEDVVSPYGVVMGVRLSVSIHVLRRGRCVQTHPTYEVGTRVFQSTSSEEDVVSYRCV